MQQSNMSYSRQAAPAHAPPGGGGYGRAPMQVPGGPPPGTFTPGTKIQVGSHRVVIQKYLSEGGFAHVYVVQLPKPVNGTDIAVLKRVAVPDKDALRNMRTEVETMKRLKGHRAIVTYIDSHASEMKNGGYEVFLLMEYCNGGGLIDLMNTRLQHRLTEPEILHIFADIAEGVACMHYLKPPLLHRDIKVENVLITTRGDSKRFMVCDFGSAAIPTVAPTNVVECRLMDEDVQKHTTLQYRSPEMVDVYRKQPINEKSDIWALGVLLYKLCYYTTPFEDQGQLAILNASFRYPSQPVFSDRLKKLIGSMLRESMQARPNIYQVLKEACTMRGRDIPIQDIYSGRQAHQEKPLPQDPESHPKLTVGAVISAPREEKQQLPDITPMRRGRPTAAPVSAPTPNLDSRRVTEGDPFAALDTKAGRKGEEDELSTRFPSINEFSLLHDTSGRFNFDSSKPAPTSKPSKDINQRLSEKLADSAFASPSTAQVSQHLSPQRNSVVAPLAPSPVTTPLTNALPIKPQSAPPKPESERPQSVMGSRAESPALLPNPHTSRYVSTGTMTTEQTVQNRALTAGTPSSTLSVQGPVDRFNLPQSAKRAPFTIQQIPTRPLSVQPADALRRQQLDYPASRPRPASTYLEATNAPERPTFEPLPAQPPRSTSLRAPQHSSNQSPSDQPGDQMIDASEPTDNLDAASHRTWRLKEEQGKDLPPVSLVEETTQGKFSKSFNQSERNLWAEGHSRQDARAPSLLKSMVQQDPIIVDESDSQHRGLNSYVDQDDAQEHMTPEMRREIERLQLEEEERRVKAAQAEHRSRIAQGKPAKPIPPPKNPNLPTRSSTIQNRVQAFLADDQRQPSVPKTAEGYGKYSDAATAASKIQKSPPEIRRKPIMGGVTRASSLPQGRPLTITNVGGSSNTGTSRALPLETPIPSSRPAAPKKPTYLNQLPTGDQSRSSNTSNSTDQQKPLVAMDLPGQPMLDMSAQERDDYVESFSKRFPSLSAIEMRTSNSQ